MLLLIEQVLLAKKTDVWYREDMLDADRVMEKG